jgi:hypothetical protein
MTHEPHGAHPSGERSNGGRPGGPTRPSLRPTRPATLVVAGLVAAALAWLGISRFYGDIPDISLVPGLTLAGLAVVEGVTGSNTRARIEHRPGSGPVNALLVARLVVLAKASSLAGAIFVGVYGGVAVWAIGERGRLRVAEANLAPAVVGLIGALALVVAALLLERACRVPRPPDEEEGAGDEGGVPPPPT